MIQLGQAQKNQLTALKKECKRLQKQLEAIHKKPDTKTSRMEHSRSKSLNIRWRRLSNTQGLAVRFSASQVRLHTGRQRIGTRSSRG